jgi:ZipA, C-terminal FtsZ-binding domain
MTIDLLSIILIVIAALGVMGVLLALFYRKKQNLPLEKIENDSQGEAAADSAEPIFVRSRIEPTISKPSFSDPTLTSLGFNTLDVLPVKTEKISVMPVAAKAEQVEIIPENPTEKMAQNNPATPKAFINFYIVAPANQPFVGYELHQALLAAELRFGKMNIFHRHENADGTGDILFSLSSAVPPGIFDIANIGGFSCPGLSVFIRPAKTKNPQAAFDLMVETARQLVDELGGELCDEESRPLSERDILAMRNQVAEDRKQKS